MPTQLSTAGTSPRDAEARTSDQRASPRIMTISRVVALTVNGDRGLARLRNISNGGVECSTPMKLRVGQRVRLHLSDIIEADARVVWTHNDQVGMAFEEQRDCGTLLSQLIQDARSGKSRAFRLPVMKPAEATSERGAHNIVIRDVSQRGMKVRHDGDFSPGLRVKVSLPGGGDRRGIVRWQNGDLAGIELVDTFSPEELSQVSKL